MNNPFKKIFNYFRQNISNIFTNNKDNTATDASASLESNEHASSQPSGETSSAFYEYLPNILLHEGGFVDDPDDPGGATNKGITLHTFKQYADQHLSIEPTFENFKNLTDEQAGLIYKNEYWDQVQGDKIKDPDLAYQITDFQINAGNNATKVLQETLNEMGHNLSIDGFVGENTLSAINNTDTNDLYRKYRDNRIKYYREIVKRNAKLQKFLNGWLSRANSFQAY